MLENFWRIFYLFAMIFATTCADMNHDTLQFKQGKLQHAVKKHFMQKNQIIHKNVSYCMKYKTCKRSWAK